jgi:hypothetical protein
MATAFKQVRVESESDDSLSDSQATTTTTTPSNFTCPVDGCVYHCKNKQTLNKHLKKLHPDIANNFIDTSKITVVNKQKSEINSFLDLLKIAFQTGTIPGVSTTTSQQEENKKLIEDVLHTSEQVAAQLSEQNQAIEEAEEEEEEDEEEELPEPVAIVRYVKSCIYRTYAMSEIPRPHITLSVI